MFLKKFNKIKTKTSFCKDAKFKTIGWLKMLLILGESSNHYYSASISSSVFEVEISFIILWKLIFMLNKRCFSVHYIHVLADDEIKYSWLKLLIDQIAFIIINNIYANYT